MQWVEVKVLPAPSDFIIFSPQHRQDPTQQVLRHHIDAMGRNLTADIAWMLCHEDYTWRAFDSFYILKELHRRLNRLTCSFPYKEFPRFHPNCVNRIAAAYAKEKLEAMKLVHFQSSKKPKRFKSRWWGQWDRALLLDNMQCETLLTNFVSSHICSSDCEQALPEYIVK